jgi:hypothetical protein
VPARDGRLRDWAGLSSVGEKESGRVDVGIRISGPHIADEAFDGEIMILNLASGNYYSLEGVGAEVWRAIRGGRPPVEILESLTSAYRGGPGAIGGALEAFLSELEAEGLIQRTGTGSPAGAGAEGRGQADFVSPELQKYTDMQALLLIDPIHATDERGWPHVPSTEGPLPARQDP